MEKKHIEHFFDNAGKIERYDIFNITLPITLIHKKLFSLNEQLLKEKYGLIHSELDVLAALYFNGKILSPTDLYDSIVFSSGGMTKVLKKLQALNYISRVACESDKRSTLVKLENEGEKILLACLDEIAILRAKMFDFLSTKEKEDLKNVLKKISLNLF